MNYLLIIGSNAGIRLGNTDRHVVILGKFSIRSNAHRLTVHSIVFCDCMRYVPLSIIPLRTIRCLSHAVTPLPK